MKFPNLFCFNSSSKTSEVDDKISTDTATRKRNAHLRQFVSILCGYILMIDVGVQVSWSSPALEYLQDEKTENYITKEQGGFLTAIDSAASLIGFLTYPLIMNRIGRRYTIFVYGLIQLLAWIMIIIAQNYFVLCIARVFVGAGYGGSFGFLTIYIGEISEKSLRGMFLSVDKICVNLGGFIVNAAGAFLPYRSMNICMGVIPLIALGLFPLMLETPYFHLLKDHEKKAIEVQMQLTGEKYHENVQEDIVRMKKTIKECEDSEKNALHELITDRGSRKALIIKLITEFTYSFSGFLAIQSYSRQIFDATGSKLPSAYAAMIVTGVQIFAGIPSSQLVDRWGRRPIYLFSGIMSSLTLLVVGTFFFFEENLKVNMSAVSWLPLVAMVLYQISVNMGISTIPYIYSGELFSVKVKGLACMISLVCHSLSGFVVKLLLPILKDSIGLSVPFWFFAIVCIVGPVTVYKNVPETKGKHLEEVLDLMSHGNKPRVSKKDAISRL